MPNRRDFLKTSAARRRRQCRHDHERRQLRRCAPAPTKRINIAFLGVGGRCQQHIDIINKLVTRKTAACAPWRCAMSGTATARSPTAPAAAFIPRRASAASMPTTASTSPRIIAESWSLREVHAVCIAAPDHWHAKMAIDAAAAGKHIYCEKPMTKTIAEAHAVVDAARRANVVMTVGVQSMSDPSVRAANELIRRGELGPHLPGPDELLSQLRGRPVALLSADAHHEPQDHRLDHVPWAQLFGLPEHAARARRFPSIAPSMPSGAATGLSAAACSPIFSSIAPRRMIGAMGVRYPGPRRRRRRHLPGI